jgi:hypothetical protein
MMDVLNPWITEDDRTIRAAFELTRARCARWLGAATIPGAFLMEGMTMQRVAIGISLLFGPLAFAHAADPQASAPLQTVLINVSEPTTAAHQTQALLGECYGHEVTIKFHHSSSSSAIESTVSVEVGRDSHTYDSTVPFVRELDYGSQTAYQFWIVCDNDREKHILLTAWGVSPGSDPAHPGYRRAQVTFSSHAELVGYSGLIDEEFAVLRSHIR